MGLCRDGRTIISCPDEARLSESLERIPVISNPFSALSSPGLSRPPRLLRLCAITIEIAGTSPAMTAQGDSSRPKSALEGAMLGERL
jgi:hypothetical protein